MIGSKDKKGHTEEKIETIKDLAEELLKDVEKEELDKEAVKKKLNQIYVVSKSLVAMGEHIRKEIEKKIEAIDSALMKYI